MEEKTPNDSKENENADVTIKQIDFSHYDFEKKFQTRQTELKRSLYLAQTFQEKKICNHQIQALIQAHSYLKDATPSQKLIADHIIGEILNAMPEYDIEASEIFCSIIKGVAKGCVGQINEWRLNPTGQIQQMATSITDLMGSVYRITTANQDVPESIKEDALAYMIYNEWEHFVKGKKNKTLLTEFWKTATDLIENTSFEQKGEIVGRMIGDALVFKFISKLPKITKYGMQNLVRDSEVLISSLADGTFSAAKSINIIEESIKNGIASRIGFRGITEIPKTLLFKEYLKLAQEFERPLNQGAFEEAFIANAGMEEGFFEEILVRPQENGSSIDFITANSKKRIDIKSHRSTFTNPQGKTYKKFNIEKIKKKLEKDLARKEITLFNTSQLNKTDLVTLMETVKAITPELERHLVHYCFNEQNILDLASEGIKLPRMIKDAKTSPIGFAFYQLNADQITPFQMMQEILKVTPVPELAAVIKNLKETTHGLYLGTISSDSDSTIIPQDSIVDTDESWREKEDPAATTTINKPSDPPPYQPSNLLLAHLTDIEYEGLTFKKMINKAKEERFKRMVKELSNRAYTYSPKTHKEDIDLQIQNTEIAFNRVADLVSDIQARNSKLLKIRVGTSQSLMIADTIKQKDLKLIQKINTWDTAYNYFPEIKKLIDNEITMAIFMITKSLKQNFTGQSMVARLNLFNLKISGWIGDAFENFKLDIAQCYFDSDGKLKKDADLDTASKLTAKFFRSISYDRASYEKYRNHAEKHNLWLLKRCMDEELKSVSPDQKIQIYYNRQKEQLLYSGFIQVWWGLGYNGITDRIFNNQFNKTFLSCINYCTRDQFPLANQMIQSQKNEDDKNFLRNIYKHFYVRAYNEQGILRIYERDPFIYHKTLAAALAKVPQDTSIQDRINTILSLRDLMKERLANIYKISSVDRPLEVDHILYMLVTFKLGSGADPLVTFAADPIYSKIINYFFNKDGKEKNLDGFVSGEDNVYSETILHKFFASNPGFFREKVDINILINKLEDKAIIMKLFKYLEQAAKSDNDFIKESYRSIFKTIARMLREDKIDMVNSLGNFMFISQPIGIQTSENYKRILYLARECFRCFINYNRFDGKKFILLKTLFQKINELFTSNYLNCASKVDEDLSTIFDIFKIDVATIEQPSNEFNPINEILKLDDSELSTIIANLS